MARRQAARHSCSSGVAGRLHLPWLRQTPRGGAEKPTAFVRIAKDMWCIPQVDGEYVARMEDVLDLYAEASDPKRPVICFDESPTQLIGEARLPSPRCERRAIDDVVTIIPRWHPMPARCSS